TNTSVTDSIQNLSSPYYLHPNKNLALVFISPILKGSNYHSWAKAMRMALLSKNKLQFFDGTLPAPVTIDTLYLVWEQCNTMVLSWITQSLSSSIAQSILWIDKSVEV